MNKAMIALAMLALAGCTPRVEEVSYPMPEGLKDCQSYRLTNESGSQIVVIRCPNSNVTAKTGGKNSKTTVVAEGGRACK